MTPAIARRPNTAHPMIKPLVGMKKKPSRLIKGTRWMCTPEAHSIIVRGKPRGVRDLRPDPSVPGVTYKIVTADGGTAFVEYRPHSDPEKRARGIFEVGVPGVSLLHPEHFSREELEAILREHPRALGLSVAGLNEKKPYPGEVLGKTLTWEDVGHEHVDFTDSNRDLHRRIEL